MESLKLLQEIEAWLSFNQEPSKDELLKMRNDIKQHISEQLNKPAVSIALPTQSELQETIEKIAYNQLAEEQIDDLVCKMQILDEFVKKYLKAVGNEC